MSISHIDFETGSPCDLKRAGLANYARHPCTKVHCLAVGFGDEPVGLAFPAGATESGQELQRRLLDHVAGGGLVYAHNAAFELAIWNCIMVPRYGWPVLKPEQVRCTMAMAYAMALPGALEDVAPALGIEQRKDAAGKRIMLQLCQPRGDGKLWSYAEAPEKFEKLYVYCCQDVEVERAIHKRLLELSPSEQKLWVLDQTINDRGVRVDLPAIEKAIRLVDSEKARLDGEMCHVTGNVVKACTEVAQIVKWARYQGVDLTGLAKADVNEALDREDLPEPVRRALHLRKEAAKSSTAKLTAMRDRAGKDGRVRGIHQYHGASTGRWAGRGIQLQNYPRPRKEMAQDMIEDVIEHLHDKDYVDMFYGPTMDAIADSLRGMIIPAPHCQLVAVDFSAIEARVLAWLAGEQHVLDTFARGEDIYKAAASRIYGVSAKEVTKDQRQIGKVATLALGYGGGKGAFQQMAKNYGIKVSDELAEDIKTRWRNAHPRIAAYWYDLERAAVAALTEGEQVCRGVRFKKAGSFLWCKLPSGRVLCYPYPEIREVTTPWGEQKDALTYMTQVSNLKAKIVDDPNSSGTWKRISTYSGAISENITQATARDLLAEALFRLEDAGFQTVAHIHDELVVEVPESCDDQVVEQIEELMSVQPKWAYGLPLAAEGWRGPRYRK